MYIKQDVVLVVDDQPGIRRLLTEVLVESGYIAESAANGYECLQKVKALNPALVLMDMKMPGMDGIETLREIKRQGFLTKVIMMTAYGELEIMADAREQGAVDYVIKPFDIVSLCNLIQKNIGSVALPNLLIS